jgi:hypothetical protein
MKGTFCIERILELQTASMDLPLLNLVQNSETSLPNSPAKNYWRLRQASQHKHIHLSEG